MKFILIVLWIVNGKPVEVPAEYETLMHCEKARSEVISTQPVKAAHCIVGELH